MASRCRESLRLVYAIIRGNKRTMFPLSTNAKLCRLLILPSGQCSRAGMMYHSLTDRRSEFGVANSRLGRCSPMAWLSMPSTCTLMCAYAPANCGCTFARLRSVAVGHPRKRHQEGGPKSPTGAVHLSRSAAKRGGHLGRLARHDLSASTNGSVMRSLWGAHCRTSDVCFLRVDRSHGVRCGERTRCLRVRTLVRMALSSAVSADLPTPRICEEGIVDPPLGAHHVEPGSGT